MQTFGYHGKKRLKYVINFDIKKKSIIFAQNIGLYGKMET